MRFVLDHDVSSEVRPTFIDAGHECWTAGNAGLARATDEEIAVYAHNQHAALVSHDIEFAKWRKKRTVGQHVWLHCPEPDAPEVAKKWLDRIVEDLNHMSDVVLTISRDSYNVNPGNWPKD